jgi:hypothetical protein
VAAADLARLVAYVRKNRELLLRYWSDADMDTGEFLAQLRRVEDADVREG